MLGTKQKSFGAVPPKASGLSIIGEDMVIVGNVTATGDLHLDGSIEGDVKCASFTLGTTGRVIGHLIADKVQLAGHLEGTVSARELRVEASARFVGELSYETVNIAAGAHIDGRVAHRSPNAQESPLKLIANQD